MFVSLLPLEVGLIPAARDLFGPIYWRRLIRHTKENTVFSTNWNLSPRKYDVVVERGIRIPVGDGIELIADVYRPDSEERFPVLFAPSPYLLEAQTAPMMPVGFTYPRAWLEAGDPNFFVRRGYVMVIATIRGARGSTGYFSNIEPDLDTVRDIYDAIAWLSERPWSDGKVGMLGAS